MGMILCNVYDSLFQYIEFFCALGPLHEGLLIRSSKMATALHRHVLVMSFHEVIKWHCVAQIQA